MVPPGIGARLDGDESVAALLVGETTAGTTDIGIERRRVLIYLMSVTSRRIGLPDLDQRTAHRSPISIQQPAAHDDTLSQWLALVLTGEIAL